MRNKGEGIGIGSKEGRRSKEEGRRKKEQAGRKKE